ncbi:p-hydroxylaminobenzoate lyase [Hirsutella rhossiliensis]|uniref:p-hydroxylaminobenzoate lyase n=1 Tax=Hirsutella rhossiliensis TaxID=111463 RepID=A0A9P8N2K2_9HYPO|nr:p-hydroxylaminobenzoate lyase [Hirsutella rhossiliensis]KAH0965452.1 p-hydroxylaminobenzoate lyase [Hirsutella rhossiliensis]
MGATSSDKTAVLDLARWPTAEQFVTRCCMKPRTPGQELEARLNRDFGPGNEFYQDFCRYIRQGLREGWVAETEITGPEYRRGKIALPSERTRYFSITTVYMESPEDGVLRGEYHQHPYGEINCVVPVDTDDDGKQKKKGRPELRGLQGWQGAGWTSPGPGSHHYPEVRGGALVSVVILPAGRICYEAEPGRPQPTSV